MGNLTNFKFKNAIFNLKPGLDSTRTRKSISVL